MRRDRRGKAAAIAVPILAMSLAMTACAGGGGSSTADDKLVLGMTADIEGLSPDIQPAYQGWFADAVWDTLLICDDLAQPSPQLAEEWEVNADSTAITVKLREGVTFNDGSVLDATDVQASYELQAAVNARFEGITFESSGANELTIIWPAPVASLTTLLCEPNVTSAEAIESGTIDNTVVGSGPYIYDAAASSQGSVYVLKKNPDYWDAETYPYENLELRVYENETAAVNALGTNQIDGTLVSTAAVEEARNSGSEVVTLRGQTTRLLITDHNGEKIPALGDVRVRQAMNMVFDRNAVAEQLYRGNADPAFQIFRPGSDAYLEDLTEDPYPFDVEAAKALMEEAGYADGFTLQIPFMDGVNHELLFPYVTEQLAQLNITVEQVNLTGPDAISNLLSGEYPVPLWQLGNYGDSTIDIQDYVLTPGIWNVMHQDDAKIDELWQKVLTGTDEEKVAAQKEINQYVIDQAWFVPMAYPDGFYAHAPEVKIPQVSDLGAQHPLLRDFQK